MTGFFDEYPAFLQTSNTGVSRARLNGRHAALIAPNRHLLEGRAVLGIQARPRLVAAAGQTMREYGVPESADSFVPGDIHEEIQRVAADRNGVVLCFGFFHHTLHHQSGRRITLVATR